MKFRSCKVVEFMNIWSEYKWLKLMEIGDLVWWSLCVINIFEIKSVFKIGYYSKAMDFI